MKYFVKRPPMDLVAEANTASAKRCCVRVQEIDCWIICNLVGCSHTSSTCSNMKSDSSKSMQKGDVSAAVACSHASMSGLSIQSTRCCSSGGVRSKMRSRSRSGVVALGSSNKPIGRP